MIYRLNTLYKRDSNGKIREYTIEWSGNCNELGTHGVLTPGYRTVAGIQGGKMVTSEWKFTEGKNIGKVNETSPLEQAEKEAIAKWEKKEEKEYFEDIEKVDSYDKFKPMLAHDYTKRPQNFGWSQPKLDGIRCIARKDGLFTRAGKEINTCGHIEHDLIEFFKEEPDIILDGELYNHELKADFNKITSLVRRVKPTPEEAKECFEKVQYHIYDCFDKNRPDEIFSVRSFFIGEDNPEEDSLRFVETTLCETQEELDKKYSDYTEAGYEGQMVRNDTPYENKRSKNLLKRKEFITEEFDVINVLEGQGNWAGYAKHFELELGDGRNFKSGVRGNQKTLRELLEQDDKPTWVTCRYFEKTPDGIPRFPVVIDWGNGARED
jgi:ATP-dependent DNA ligase